MVPSRRPQAHAGTGSEWMKLGVVFGYWGAQRRAGVRRAGAGGRAPRLRLGVGRGVVGQRRVHVRRVGRRRTPSTIKIGTGVVQIAARTPTATAMAAVTLDHLSNGRLILGLGVSGPQVVEGWYGQPSNKPLARTREYVEIIRRALRREGPLEFDGEFYPLPYRGRGQRRPGQAAQDHDPPAARRHPDLPRCRGPEERHADRGDRRRLAAALLLAVPAGGVRRPARGREGRLRDRRRS